MLGALVALSWDNWFSIAALSLTGISTLFAVRANRRANRAEERAERAEQRSEKAEEREEERLELTPPASRAPPPVRLLPGQAPPATVWEGAISIPVTGPPRVIRRDGQAFDVRAGVTLSADER